MPDCCDSSIPKTRVPEIFLTIFHLKYRYSKHYRSFQLEFPTFALNWFALTVATTSIVCEFTVSITPMSQWTVQPTQIDYPNSYFTLYRAILKCRVRTFSSRAIVKYPIAYVAVLVFQCTNTFWYVPNANAFKTHFCIFDGRNQLLQPPIPPWILWHMMIQWNGAFFTSSLSFWARSLNALEEKEWISWNGDLWLGWQKQKSMKNTLTLHQRRTFLLFIGIVLKTLFCDKLISITIQVCQYRNDMHSVFQTN